MVIAEMRNETAAVRIHDECFQKETGQAMAEASRIVSLSYQRRASAAAPALFANISMQTPNH